MRDDRHMNAYRVVIVTLDRHAAGPAARATQEPAVGASAAADSALGAGCADAGQGTTAAEPPALAVPTATAVRMPPHSVSHVVQAGRQVVRDLCAAPRRSC